MGREWSKEQLDYLIAHYPYERAEDVGNVIGKSTASVMHMAHKHGVYKDREALSKIMKISNSGINSGNFKGYRQRTREGYIWCHAPDHPFANSRGYVKEHRLVVEKHLGCIIPKGFVVHHINGIKDDNRIENLAVMTVGAHSALHGRKGRNMPKGEKNWKYKPININEVRKMREEGNTVEKICEKFGICKCTYYKKLREA